VEVILGGGGGVEMKRVQSMIQCENNNMLWLIEHNGAEGSLMIRQTRCTGTRDASSRDEEN